MTFSIMVLSLAILSLKTFIITTFSIKTDRIQVTGLYHPLDGVTNPKYKLLHFLTTTFFYKEKKAIAFKQGRCCHLELDL
jgi:hypothetical protein